MKFSFLILFLAWATCSPNLENNDCPTEQQSRVCGLNFTAPSKPFPNNPMPAVQDANANWIAVLPFGYTKNGESMVRFDLEWQWWGERQIGVRETIKLAKESGIKVLLKPQVYIPGGWVGTMDFKKEEDWLNWEKDYRDFILTFAKIATEMKVEQFCIGTEYEIAAIKRETFWRKLIQETREIYKGEITYAANWDGYWKVPFWDALDVAGINSYFPLVNEKTPSVKALKKAWKPHLKKMEAFYCTIQKPILFTEYGYLSVDGCAYKNWELEDKIRSLKINEEAQANAYQAFFDVFSQQEWWQGGFLWKWFPNDDGHEGYYNKDYTPQGKAALEVVKDGHLKLSLPR